MTLGLDLGGTQIKAVLLSDAGEMLRREQRPTTLDFPATVKNLVETLAPTAPVGVSAPGLAAPDGRSIAHMPGRMPGLAGLDWTTHLAREKSVPVLNDAHAALLGEAWIGAALGLRDCFMLTLGTGVGGAILAEGRILRGHLGRAGHLGHMSLDPFGPPDIVHTPGSLEDAIGNHNIAQRTGGRFATTHALIAAATAGDEFALQTWRHSIRALAAALTSLINILDPEAIILGGGIAQAGETLFTPLRAELDAIEWCPTATSVKLLPAQLGEWAGAIGAAHEARNLPVEDSAWNSRSR